MPKSMATLVSNAGSTASSTAGSSVAGGGAAAATDTLKEGFLYKWTNYIKGYQKRWFVLSNGCLSYFRNQSEVNRNCRGRICLTSAVIYPEDNCNFTISNGASQTFHLRSVNERERHEWVSALELARARAIRVQESDDEDFLEYPEGGIGQDVQSVIKSVSIKLDDLRTCHDLIHKHGSVLHRSLSELEAVFQALIHSATNGGTHSAGTNPTPHGIAAALAADGPNLLARLKTANERVTLFKITSNAMLNASEEFKSLAQGNGRKWTRLLEQEHEKKKQLESMVETLARQHSSLENAMKKVAASPEDDDDEFYDAEETTGADSQFCVGFPGKAQRISITSRERLTASGDSSSKRQAARDKSSVAGRDEDGYATDGDGNGADDDSLGSDDIMLERDEYDISHAKVVVKSRKARSIEKQQRKDGSQNGSSEKSFERELDRESTFSGSSPGTPTVPVRSSINNHLAVATTTGTQSARVRRSTIPERPNHSINLWSIMKNCIGKELTKIPMPVNFNEPLSMLQRLAEEFEYAELLHKASRCKTAAEQLCYVSAFAVTSYSASGDRLGKPFNPLLGETYECDRLADLGWRYVAEQVVHHPPVLAYHCEGRGWRTWCEFSLQSKFRGKYLQVTPIGINHLEFDDGNHYTWNKVTTTVHNIIVGKLWVDHHGEMIITNHKTKEECRLEFTPYLFFARGESRKVNGMVKDSNGIALWSISGTWDTRLEAKRVSFNESDDMVVANKGKTIWKRKIPPPEMEKMYRMTLLAIQLNEPEDGVAPTDSRLRPDQRLMEAGVWDEANRVKAQLEEAQRARRREQEHALAAIAEEGGDSSTVAHKAAWFKLDHDSVTGKPLHIFNHDYWQCKERKDWSRSPVIFQV